MHPELLVALAGQHVDELLADTGHRQRNVAPAEERPNIKRGTGDAFVANISRRTSNFLARFLSRKAA
jgi:hypothetical protein